MLEKAFWDELAKNKITFFNGVPYIYEILTRLGLKNCKLETIKTFTQAGGKLNEKYLMELIKFCKINKKEFFVMYGQAEASPRMTYLIGKIAKKK